MSPQQAGLWLRFFQRRFQFLPDRAELVTYWHRLVEEMNITSFRSHDARIVAAMQTYGISRLMTFNVQDFSGFPISIVDPASP